MVKITIVGVSVVCAMLAANATAVDQYVNLFVNEYQDQQAVAAAELADRGILGVLLGGLGPGNIGNLVSGITGGRGSAGNNLGNLLSGLTGGVVSLLGGGGSGGFLGGLRSGSVDLGGLVSNVAGVLDRTSCFKA
ncbi:hypothetical protein AX774_g7913 [Zancudomyces culisetae]|uniref:Uncharacterized protein n=1 Tax=Zancudomyces culisetae TaxID=1213189 RepID=A0A1R1PCL4_ZANCU|nr:hypothetical protein AX774_g7913 [Zancudomyces culisetae]|eukprot:OMH78693.1 hypothetical protein AX774_g7913 [Zancudomyces culisetae]